jgi:hypothetical protein
LKPQRSRGSGGRGTAQLREIRDLHCTVRKTRHGFLKLFLHKSGSADDDEEEGVNEEPDPPPEDEDP